MDGWYALFARFNFYNDWHHWFLFHYMPRLSERLWNNDTVCGTVPAILGTSTVFVSVSAAPRDVETSSSALGARAVSRRGDAWDPREGSSGSYRQLVEIEEFIWVQIYKPIFCNFILQKTYFVFAKISLSIHKLVAYQRFWAHLSEICTTVQKYFSPYSKKIKSI